MNKILIKLTELEMIMVKSNRKIMISVLASNRLTTFS